MPASRGTTSSTFSRAQNAMSSSSPGGPYVRAFSPSSAFGNARAINSAAIAASVRSRLHELHDPARAVGVVERERALKAGTDDHDVVAARRRARDRVEVQQAAEQRPARTAPQSRGSRASRSSSTGSASPRAARGTRAATRRRRSPRRAPPCAPRRRASPGSSARSASASSISAQQRTRSVARGERLRDRRRGAEDVDDDPDGSRSGLGGSESDVNAHPTTLLRTWLKPSRDLLPPSGPRDRALLLGVRAAHLHGVHDDGACRDPLSGALWQAAGRPARDTRRPARDLRGRRREGDSSR